MWDIYIYVDLISQIFWVETELTLFTYQAFLRIIYQRIFLQSIMSKVEYFFLPNYKWGMVPDSTSNWNYAPLLFIIQLISKLIIIITFAETACKLVPIFKWRRVANNSSVWRLIRKFGKTDFVGKSFLTLTDTLKSEFVCSGAWKTVMGLNHETTDASLGRRNLREGKAIPVISERYRPILETLFRRQQEQMELDELWYQRNNVRQTEKKLFCSQTQDCRRLTWSTRTCDSSTVIVFFFALIIYNAVRAATLCL